MAARAFDRDYRSPQPWTPRGLEDPRPWFRDVLPERVLYDARSDLWHAVGYAEVRELFRDYETWTLARRLEHLPPQQRLIRLLLTDPPDHRALRNKFSRAYRPRRIAALEERVRQHAKSLLGACLDKGRFDVVGDLAAPLTRDMIGGLIGVPGEDLEELSAKAIRHPLGAVEPDARGERVVSVWMGGGEPAKNAEWNAYFQDLLEARRASPRDDLVSDLAAIPEGELRGTFDLGCLLDEQFGAGQNTSVHLISMMLAVLHDHPDQLRRLRAEPGLVSTAVEESLRYCAPLQGRPRVSARAAPLGPVRIPEDAVVVGWIQAAHLDGEAFDDPLRFDIAREPNNHLAFGWGAHFCLGAALARIEARVVLEEWLAHIGEFAAADPGPKQWLPSFFVRGLAAYEVDAKPAD